MVGTEVAGTESVEELLRLMERFYGEERYPFDRDVARAALLPLLGDSAIGRVWVFREDDEAVGYFVLTLGWSLEYHGRDAFVDELFIAPSHRGRGLGQRALEVLDEACRELSVRALHLEVERDNEFARELYRKRGFSENGRLLMTKRFDSRGSRE